MLEIAIGALIIALIAGALGFTGIAAGAAAVAKVIFGVFLVLAILLFLLVMLGVGVADAVGDDVRLPTVLAEAALASPAPSAAGAQPALYGPRSSGPDATIGSFSTRPRNALATT